MSNCGVPYSVRVARAASGAAPSISSPRQKIILIGCGGAGKSTLARALGERLGLPVHHLDALYWEPGWIPREKEAWRDIQMELCARPAWILDGNYGGTMDLRIAAADTIVFFDFPRALCIYRILKRTFLSLGRARVDMPGCPEKVNLEYLTFLRWAWNYPRDRRPAILEKLHSVRATKEVVILRSPREVAAFLAALEPNLSPQASLAVG